MKSPQTTTGTLQGSPLRVGISGEAAVGALDKGSGAYFESHSFLADCCFALALQPFVPMLDCNPVKR